MAVGWVRGQLYSHFVRANRRWAGSAFGTADGIDHGVEEPEKWPSVRGAGNARVSQGVQPTEQSAMVKQRWRTAITSVGQVCPTKDVISAFTATIATRIEDEPPFKVAAAGVGQ